MKKLFLSLTIFMGMLYAISLFASNNPWPWVITVYSTASVTQWEYGGIENEPAIIKVYYDDYGYLEYLGELNPWGLNKSVQSKTFLVDNGNKHSQIELEYKIYNNEGVWENSYTEMYYQHGASTFSADGLTFWDGGSDLDGKGGLCPNSQHQQQTINITGSYQTD